jgi:hypothetical protein
MYQGLEGQIAKGFLSEGVKLTIKDRYVQCDRVRETIRTRF